MWSFAALLAVEVESIPTFEILSVALTVSFLTTSVWLTYSGRWKLIAKQPQTIWIPGVIGVFFNDLAYFTAFKYAPAAQVDIINYLWPMLIVLMSAVLPKHSLKRNHLIAAGLGFIGASLAIWDTCSEGSFQISHLLGYFFALLSAFSWSFYIVCSMQPNHKAPIEMIGMFCGVGAILAIGTHTYFETTMWLEMQQVATLLVIGATTCGAAYYFWIHGIQHGDSKRLTILSYWVPLASISILVFQGKAECSPLIIVSGCLVTTATMLIKKEAINENS